MCPAYGGDLLLFLPIIIGAGTSLGIAGPAAEIGMVVAYHIATLLGFSSADINTLAPLVIAGAGAGVAANFNTPLTGAMFAAEVSRQLVVSKHGEDHSNTDKALKSTTMLILAAVASSSKYLNDRPFPFPTAPRHFTALVLTLLSLSIQYYTPGKDSFQGRKEFCPSRLSRL